MSEVTRCTSTNNKAVSALKAEFNIAGSYSANCTPEFACPISEGFFIAGGGSHEMERTAYRGSAPKDSNSFYASKSCCKRCDLSFFVFGCETALGQEPYPIGTVTVSKTATTTCPDDEPEVTTCTVTKDLTYCLSIYAAGVDEDGCIYQLTAIVSVVDDGEFATCASHGFFNVEYGPVLIPEADLVGVHELEQEITFIDICGDEQTVTGTMKITIS